MSSYQLLSELCTCGDKAELLCSEGKCLHPRSCGVHKYNVLLKYGRGCHSFKRNIDRNIEFKKVMKYDVDDKQYKFVVTDSLPYNEFVPHFIGVLQQHIKHIYKKYLIIVK